MSDDKPAKPESDLLAADGVEDLLATDDRKTVDVYVPEWKKTVRIRQLTAAESIIVSELPKNEGMTSLVAMSVIDSAGNRLFKDAERLKGKSAGALGRIQDEALKLNGFSGGRAAAAAAAVKNA